MSYYFIVENEVCGVSEPSQLATISVEGIDTVIVTRTVGGSLFNEGVICFNGSESKNISYYADVSTMPRGTNTEIQYNWFVNGTSVMGWTTLNPYAGLIGSAFNDGDVVTVEVRLHNGTMIPTLTCGFTHNYTNTIETQNPNDLRIDMTGDIVCGESNELTFTAMNAIGGTYTWTLNGHVEITGTNVLTFTPMPFLEPGTHTIALDIEQPGCPTAHAQITEVISEHIELSVTNSPISGTRTGNVIELQDPNPLQGIDLTMVISNLAGRTGVEYEWSIIDEVTEAEYPLIPGSIDSIITTSPFDEAFQTAGFTQIIQAKVWDDKGCETMDTIKISVRGKFQLEGLVVTAQRERSPDGAKIDLWETDSNVNERTDDIPNRFKSDITICHDQIIYFTPQVTEGSEGPFTLKWETSVSAQLYVNGVKQDRALPAEFTMNSVDEYPIGFRVNAASGSQVVFTLTITNGSGNTATGEILIHVKPAPYMSVRVEPTMFGNAYYENQIINFVANPSGRFDTIEFFRLIGDYYGHFEFFEDGKAQPFVSSSSVFNSRIPAGTVRGMENRQIQAVVNGRDAYGCFATDTITIRLLPVPSVLIPDDPHNELNRVLFPDFDIEVFDTWGLKVQGFGTLGWNAKYNGRIVRSGTYYYNVRIPSPDGYQIVSGAITVIRDREFDY
jgi:hypothetical protein